MLQNRKELKRGGNSGEKYLSEYVLSDIHLQIGGNMSNDFRAIILNLLTMIAVIFVLIPTIESAFNLSLYIDQSLLTTISVMLVSVVILAGFSLYQKRNK